MLWKRGRFFVCFFFSLVQFPKCLVAQQQVILKYLGNVVVVIAVMEASSVKQFTGFKSCSFIFFLHYDYLKILHISVEGKGFLVFLGLNPYLASQHCIR